MSGKSVNPSLSGRNTSSSTSSSRTNKSSSRRSISSLPSENNKKSNNENYLLLSCKEFDTVAEEMIEKDEKDENILQNRRNTNKNFLEYLNNIGVTHEPIKNQNNSQYNKKYKKYIENKLKEYKKKSNNQSISDENPQFKNYLKNEKNTLLEEYKKKMLRSKSKHFTRGFIKWDSYADKSPNIKMDKYTITKVRGSKIIFLAYFTFDEPEVTTIIDQIMFLNTLSHYGAAEINIVLPYFPVGTMERLQGEGETPTGYTFAHMLNSIPQGDSKNKLYIFDIHAQCSRFFFQMNIIPILLTMMPEYIYYINKIKDGTNVIVFPDDGAKKRFEKVMLSTPESSDIIKITCSKERKGTDRIIKIDDGFEKLYNETKEKNGKTTIRTLKEKKYNFFIIDDLVQTGGTLKKTIMGIQKSLSECQGFNKDTARYYPLVTHSVFPDKSNEGFYNFSKMINKQNNVPVPVIEEVVTSNSRPTKIIAMQARKTTQSEKNTLIKKVKSVSIAEPLSKIFRGETNGYIAPYILR